MCLCQTLKTLDTTPVNSSTQPTPLFSICDSQQSGINTTLKNACTALSEFQGEVGGQLQGLKTCLIFPKNTPQTITNSVEGKPVQVT